MPTPPRTIIANTDLVTDYPGRRSLNISRGPSSPNHVSPSPRPSAVRSYVDASTQYSPDGLPPTASKELAKKRKQHALESSGQTPPPPTSHSDATTPAAQVPEAPSNRDGSVETNESSSTRLTVVAAVSQPTQSPTTNPKIMPEKYETCEPRDLGFLIANMLMELIRLNDALPLRDGKLTRFHSRAPPAISCHDYLVRLIQHATLSPPILLSMVYYIDRLCALYPAFTVNSLTVHRFLITAATVASKGLSDSFWTNVTYARIGGIGTSELATLELDFLQRVEFRIVPRPEMLVDYYRSLVQRSPGYVLETTDAERRDVEMS